MSEAKTDPRVASVPLRDISTRHQIDTLLQVAGVLHHYLCPVAAPADATVQGMPPEARIAAENTFIKLCERIEDVLGDGSRWDTSQVIRIEENAQRAVTLGLALQEAQRVAVQDLHAPHTRYKPSLVRTGEGWVAYIGGFGGDSEHTLAGGGATPREALDNFDNAFNGVVLDRAQQDWLAQRENRDGENTQTNEENSMDGHGHSGTPETPGERLPDSGHSGGAEQDGNISGA